MKIIEIETTEKRVRVEFNGIIYTRYPQSKRHSDRNYFRCKTNLKKQGFGLLHRDIWKFYNGEILEGFEVHHKDHNSLNNDISNLECIHKDEHQKLHVPTPEQRRAIAYINSRKFALEKATKEAVNWHKSEEGRKWHSEHGKRLIAERKLKPLTKNCENCKKDYQTVSVSSADRFCSKKCQSAWRRAQGLDNENRVCQSCQKTFSVNKYDKSECCSLSCAAKFRWVKRKSKASQNVQLALSTSSKTAQNIQV
jgi:hypothetical protein